MKKNKYHHQRSSHQRKVEEDKYSNRLEDQLQNVKLYHSPSQQQQTSCSTSDNNNTDDNTNSNVDAKGFHPPIRTPIRVWW
ncbi:unnamed protein product [Ambrosiozyma monospora]|uniref:Unnamed protein product n=1 Tax=Ambrosiozyma monospora TaxID=43982 RepID=A0A9W7DFJ9_AMBMO|nr:unnamed protein product [Ambrosiozyma monospora]